MTKPPNTEAIERKRANDRERMRRWRAANPERALADARESMRRHRASNPEASRKTARKYRATHLEVTRARNRAWRANDLPKAAYLAHKGAAKQRGIPFLLTFDGWWAIWEASGKWEQRGVHDPDKYCMARHGDRGGYVTGNVRIITNRENAMERRCSAETRRKMSEAAKARWARHRARTL